MDKIYNNLTIEGMHTAKYKQEIVYKTLRVMPKIMSITVDKYAKMLGFSKQYLFNCVNVKHDPKLSTAYFYASINNQILQEKFKDQKDINIDKICDILYINTDNYTEDQIEDSLAILQLLPKYKLYKNVLIECINKI